MLFVNRTNTAIRFSSFSLLPGGEISLSSSNKFFKKLLGTPVSAYPESSLEFNYVAPGTMSASDYRRNSSKDAVLKAEAAKKKAEVEKMKKEAEDKAKAEALKKQEEKQLADIKANEKKDEPAPKAKDADVAKAEAEAKADAEKIAAEEKKLAEAEKKGKAASAKK